MFLFVKTPSDPKVCCHFKGCTGATSNAVLDGISVECLEWGKLNLISTFFSFL